MLANSFFDRDPERRPSQRWVNRALDGRLQDGYNVGPIRLGPEHRYVIFSDHHKGARTRADAFRQCEATYLAALDYYHARGYTLIILGDGEELLEEPVEKVMKAYENVLRSEARFHPGCMIRVYGNHDIQWQTAEMARQFLDPFFPGIEFRQELVFRYDDGEFNSGDIFLIHGYQGTMDSDMLAFMARIVLPYYRNFQIRTGFGATSPSRDACLRSLHDNRLYRWASRKSKLMLIAGHTHRPVWSSKTHLDKLTGELYDLLQLEPEQRSSDYEERVLKLKHEIEERQAKFPPCMDIIKTKPCYFNTGCCQFEDGDITGIEIENGVIRLIKWGKDGGDTNHGEMLRSILEQNSLAEIFFYL